MILIKQGILTAIAALIFSMLFSYFMDGKSGGQTIILRTAGILIFLYGYGILLPVRTGKRQNHDSTALAQS